MESLRWCSRTRSFLFLFFFNVTATTEIYTLYLHDAIPICSNQSRTRSSKRFKMVPIPLRLMKMCVTIWWPRPVTRWTKGSGWQQDLRIISYVKKTYSCLLDRSHNPWSQLTESDNGRSVQKKGFPSCGYSKFGWAPTKAKVFLYLAVFESQ